MKSLLVNKHVFVPTVLIKGDLADDLDKACIEAHNALKRYSIKPISNLQH